MASLAAAGWDRSQLSRDEEHKLCPQKNILPIFNNTHKLLQYENVKLWSQYFIGSWNIVDIFAKLFWFTPLC